MPRPNIALLYVGGSIGMVVNQKTGRIEPIESLSEIHRFLPELQREVSLNFISLTNLGSSDVTPAHWTKIAEKIADEYHKYDGFIVVHGTNTMSYTAAALAFALQGLSKPIVLTGALLPINDIAGDGRMNLIYAIRAAQLDIAEVCIAVGPRVLRGVRAKKVDQSLLKTFDTPKYPALADFSEQIHLEPTRLVRRKRTLSVQPEFEANIQVLTLHPGITTAMLDVVLQANPKGIVLRAYGPGMLPEEINPWLQQVAMKEIPLVISSQTVRGRVDLHTYRKQLTLEKLGCISGKNMITECATVKLMWALKQAKTPTKLRQLMEKNLVGELDD